MIYIHVSVVVLLVLSLTGAIMKVRRRQSVETSDWFGHSGSLEAGPRAIILPGISCHYQNQPATVLGTYLFYLKLQRPRYWRCPPRTLPQSQAELISKLPPPPSPTSAGRRGRYSAHNTHTAPPVLISTLSTFISTLLITCSIWLYNNYR